MREKLSRIEEELQDINSRWRWVTWTLVGLVTLLVGRLWYLQVLHGEKLRQYSEMNRLKQEKIPSPRGLIFDRHHNILVDNLPGLELSITPQYLQDLKQVAKDISLIIEEPPDQIIKKVQASEKDHGPFRPVSVKQHLSLDQVSRLKFLQWDHRGVDIQETIVRNYPLKKNGANLFGYLGEISESQISKLNKKYKNRFHFHPGDLVGKNGLEAVWELELRGKDGFSFVEVDVHNRKSSSSISGLWNLKSQKPVPGNNLILTIDKELQEKTYSSFFRKDKMGTRHGSAIVMKTNGEILALVSYPSYDPNIFSKKLSFNKWRQLAQDPNKPLRNKAIQDHYAPGSVFKPIVALAALQENIINKDTLMASPSNMVFGGRTYHDYRKVGHGFLNITSAMERSANIFFYKLGISLGIDKIAEYAKMMNLGHKTNIKLEEENKGLIPDSRWKVQQFGEDWQPGENLSHAIGQGFTLVTPLQMAVFYNTIATSGNIVQPSIVKSIVDTNDKHIKTFQPEIIRNISDKIDKKHFATIQEALIKVVHGPHGTAKWWQIKGLKIAGKTGTSQVMSFSKRNIYKKCSKRPVSQRHHGWFVAYAPAHKPEITVSVLTEHSCSGSSGSAPIARDIIKFYFDNKKTSITSENS